MCKCAPGQCRNHLTRVHLYRYARHKFEEVSASCACNAIAMSTKTSSPRKPLPLRGLETLAPEFSKVQEGKEFTPIGAVEPLWRKSQPPCVTHWAFLNYVAERLLPSCIPVGCDIAHGDANIFQLPPVLDSSHASGSSTACLLLSAARESGYYSLNRYRQILLGHTERGQRVVIYVHRLICWIVNGPITEESRKRRVTCHNVSGCPPSGACCNPLHLRCEFTIYITQKNTACVESMISSSAFAGHNISLCSLRFATDATNRKDRSHRREITRAKCMQNLKCKAC